MEADQIGRTETVLYLIQTLLKWPYVLLFGTAFLLILIIGVKRHLRNKASITGTHYAKTALFVLIALIPCVWFFVTANHAYVHPRLVFRNWGVSLFALFSGLIFLFDRDVN